ncbi:FG-GAP-like repeat-containing protein [uncultured Bacteroides sp.]|uniref:FG-GAP-like repeat-containing protein n=1 Tax=uncultured Bacteroides sp. TaxID=162156 RepID=UPI0027DD3A6B|nr:FG-GAP-like repeat-containing protein [uncultured Bacteroides sp.]
MKNMTRKLIALGIALSMALSASSQETAMQGEDHMAHDVGEIPVRYALTPAGAVTYQVPVDIHPDPEEFHPHLSFDYNSRQPESAMGYGWNIGGLSGITHVAGTIYYDGKSSPLSLSEDKLMLDGVRLIKTGADSWQSEQGFVKVSRQADGTLAVRYPDGSTAKFEASPKAPFSYVMTLHTNRKGRTVKYIYTQADNLPYIRTILYGETGGVYNDSIVFTYRSVNDNMTRYADGKPLKRSRLLEKVESFHKGKLWRRYLISYQQRGVYLPVRLECETETGKLNPLRFEYGDERTIEFLGGRSLYLTNYFRNSVQGANSHKSLVLSRGKFSRDSKSDGLISYPALGETAEDQRLLVYKDLSELVVSPVVFTAGRGFKQLEAIDVNGDGLEEPVRVNYYDGRLVASVYTNDVDPARYSEYVYLEGSGYVHERQMLTGDFDGDGKIELLAISSCRDPKKKKYPSRALLVDLDKRKTIYDDACFDFTLYQTDNRALYGDRLMAMDYNGDGKTDICLININGLYVYEFTGSGFRQLAYSNAINIMYFNFESPGIKDRELMVADMNGDGNMDIVLGPRRIHCKEGFKHLGDGICRGACNDESHLRSTSASGYKHYVHPYSGHECLVDPSVRQHDLVVFDWNVENGKQWKFLISTGNSSYTPSNPGFKVHTEELFYCFHETVGLNFMLVDVDKDGLPDLLRNVRGKIYLHLNENGKISLNHNIRSILQMDNLSAQFAVANVTQAYYWSGSLICVDNEKLHAYNYTHDESIGRMLHNLTDSYGVTSNHYYTDIMETSESRYVGQPDMSLGYLDYPYAIMTPRLYVPAWQKKTKGGTQISWEYYKYTNAVFHRTGLGFCGFRKIEAKDVVNKRTMASVFDPKLLGAEVRKETPADTIIRSYVLERSKNETVILKLQKETVKDALNGTRKIIAYEHNGYGQVTGMSTASGGNKIEARSYGYQNVENSGLYLLGLKRYEQTKSFRNDSTVTRETKTDYDSRYLPVRKTHFFNGNIVSQQLYEYNNRMQLTATKKRAYESTDWLSKAFAYDRDGRLIKETDVMGLSATYAYDPATGLLQSSTDHKGRTTRHVYDAWGRLVETRNPDGHVRHVSASWSKEGDPGLYVMTVVETGKPVTKTYYDFLKREVRSSQLRFDGREMKTDKMYNPRTGLLEKESLPAKDGAPSRWNIHVYDRFGRRTSTRYASGKVDSCAYGALTDTIIENGIRRIRRYDVTGLITQVTDDAGSISYYYRPDGQPVAVVAPGDVQTRFYYDKYGRRTRIKDPSAGIRQTEYDKNGNICKETDADGREIRKEYDRYGRLTKQITPDLTTVYAYDNTENLLLSAVSDNGSAARNTYDAYGRLKTRREEAPDGKWLQKTYSYTADGQTSSIAYVSQNGALATELLSYRNGFLTEVRLADGTPVYRHDEENALGQLTKLTVGSMRRSYEFNEWGLPVRRSITRADGTLMFAHSYRFNASNNNLESRKDETRSLSESFGYDELNRLSVYGDKSVVYDNHGNILRKGDAGELVYIDPNRPYAVTGLNPVQDNPVKSGLDIAYIAGDRPSVITQGAKKAALTYNAGHERVRMQYAVNDLTRLTRYYLGGNYEFDETVGGFKEKLYLGGGYYNAPAVLLKEGGNSSVYFVHRDYLGSILQIADTQGNVVEENSFDAWGSLRNPMNQAIYTQGEEPELLLGRGYTGHEHLPFFGLINMNARLYDPLLGRFLCPDPYVQIPDFMQSFNRYSYCMNSPLCYVDESGEFLLGYTFGFFRGLFTGKNPFKTGWQGGVNEVKIWGGLFTTDMRKNFLGQAWEMLSRFTWQSPQTFFGLAFSTFSNWAGQVDDVDYWGGATVVRGNNWNSGAVTLGSYIIGNRNIEADPNNYLFQHEYGHYLQSQEMGLAYIPTVGIPSLKSAAKSRDHSLQKFEQDANRRAFNYFNDPKNKIDGFYTSQERYDKYNENKSYENRTAKGWNFFENPLDVNGIGHESRVKYYDYKLSGAIHSPNMTLRMFWLKY